MESSKTGPKIRGKFRLFHCCTTNQDDVVAPRRKVRKTDPLLDYIAMAEKKPMVMPTILSSAFTVVKGVDGGEGSPSQRKNLEKNKSLGRALMAVFNHISLAKKINSKRKTSKDNFSKSTSTGNTEGESDKITRGETNSNTSSSNGSLAFTPSSLSSSTNSSNASTGTQSSGPLRMNEIGVTKQKENVGDSRKGYFGPDVALCLLLITSLLVLILCGKVCAIICTSTGFFVVPHRRRRPCNEGDKCK